MDYLRRPWLAIVLASVLFGLYHFPYAYYLWDNTVGNITLSLKVFWRNRLYLACHLDLFITRVGRILEQHHFTRI